MKNSHTLLLEKWYSDFARADVVSMLEKCSDKMTFQISGKSKLAGKYTRDNFQQNYFAQLNALSGGTIKFEVHDILASDLHATVLLSEKLVRDGKPVEYRSVHVWRFENGKPVAWYEYPRDLYQFDEIWA